jgi:hypothetical protein
MNTHSVEREREREREIKWVGSEIGTAYIHMTP